MKNSITWRITKFEAEMERDKGNENNTRLLTRLEMEVENWRIKIGAKVTQVPTSLSMGFVAQQHFITSST